MKSVSKNVRSLKRTRRTRRAGRTNNREAGACSFPKTVVRAFVHPVCAERLCAPSERPAARAGDSTVPCSSGPAGASTADSGSMFRIPAPGTPVYRAPHAFNAVKDTLK